MTNNGELKTQVLESLKGGHRNALTGKLLATRLGFRNDRQIRLAIRGLIKDGYPVASSVVPPLGFFIAETKDEVNLYAANLKSRLIEIALHRRDLLRATREIRQPEQMKLKF